MTTNEIVDKSNKQLKQNLIPDDSLEMECYSSEDPEIFNQPIIQNQNEKDNQNL